MAASEESASADSRLQIWIDAQLPPALARWLQAELEADAVHIADLGLLSAQDPTIFSVGRDAKRRVVILTKDDDFPKLVNQHGPPPQVVWLRCGNVRNRELRSIVLAAWPRARAHLAAGEALIEIRRRTE